ncbi:hypothetical protein GCM10023340_38700 [Nocardioides marinquilinus]|uniref:DNA (cytosine-5-)-methyltransferase n=1 Tax=Nocardioides marinquilinus TaxID=1210400 RepID=A0ABP9PZ76_9ACTN
MKLLDLFSGDGGAGEGYRRAGFTVTGVDIVDHPYPPGQFIRADAMAVLSSLWYLDQFDVVHTSPPCQPRTTMSNRYRGRGGPTDALINLIPAVIERLRTWGGRWVVENVVGARPDMPDARLLRGSMFGLEVDRPRLFYASESLPLAPVTTRTRPALGVYGARPDGRLLWTRTDGSELRAPRSVAEAGRAMGIDWMTWPDLTEAVPPAYTEWVGHALLTQTTGARSVVPATG